MQFLSKSNVILTAMEKSMLKFIWKHKRLQIAKIILSKKSIAGCITILDFNEDSLFNKWCWEN
jgi:hypothetical protein